MKLHSIRDFLAVVERGGLRAAARHLQMPQPAITRSIQDLEKELGVTLFIRNAKGAAMTQMGEVFFRRAIAVRSELQKAKDEIDQLRGATHGRLAIALSTAAHMALLPLALRPFRSRYPDVKLNIADAVFPTVEAALKNGTVDFYVGPAPELAESELLSEQLFVNTRVILGRTGHPLSRARSLRELVDAEWITTSITHKEEEELGPLFSQHGLPPPRLILRAQSSLTYLTALSSTDLLMMLPIQCLQFRQWRDELQQIKVTEELPAPPICIVQRRELPLTPAAEYFCDMVRRAAAAHARKS